MSTKSTDVFIAGQGLVRNYPSRAGFFGRITELRAVNNVSVAVARGETLGIVGESGSGKSTLGRLMLGLELPNSGMVRVDGKAMPAIGTQAWRALRRRIQLIHQDPLAALDRRIAIGSQLREPLDIHGIGTRSTREFEMITLLERMGLSADHVRRYPHELSGGQRQRVVLARALMTRPDFIVADEPVSALDVSIQAQVVNLLIDLQAEFGLTMLFISHDLRIVRQISHRIGVMYLGEIVEQGSADDLFAEPLHPYTRALVSAAPGASRAGARVVLAGEPPNPAKRPAGCAFHPRCPAALARCRSEAPQARHAGAGRIVRCHLFESQSTDVLNPAA